MSCPQKKNAPAGRGAAPSNPPCAQPMCPPYGQQAPTCCMHCTPCQPEISEDCRRALNRCGPDSSRCHPQGIFTELDEKLCGGADYGVMRRSLYPGQAKQYETARSSQVTMAAGNQRSDAMCGGCDTRAHGDSYIHVQRQCITQGNAICPPTSHPSFPSTPGYPYSL